VSPNLENCIGKGFPIVMLLMSEKSSGFKPLACGNSRDTDGKHGGSRIYHAWLALEFARWKNPAFAVKLNGMQLMPVLERLEM
jgi:hypothetical protein